MVKLTDNQLIVLSKAAAREDGAAVLPLTMNKAAAVKVGSGLIGRKLMREIRSKPGMPIWHGDADGRSMSLVITRAGRNAIGINEPDESYQQVSNKSGDTKRADRYLAAAAPRAGSKQALVVKLLSKQQGATLDALVEATGWLPHTTRAALTGPRQPVGLPAADEWSILPWIRLRPQRLDHSQSGRTSFWCVPDPLDRKTALARAHYDARRRGPSRAVAGKTGTGAARGPDQGLDRQSARPFPAGRATRGTRVQLKSR